MDNSSSYKSNLSSFFDDSLNLAAIQTRIINEEQLSPVILSSQPFNTSTVKSKKNSNLEGNNLDLSTEVLTDSDSNKTWTESTPSRELITSKDHLNDVSPIILSEKSCEEVVPASLEQLLDTPNFEWTSTLASPFTCQKASESLLKTAERQVFCPSNNSRFIVSTNSSKTCDSDSTLNESKKSDSFLSKSEVNVITSNKSPLLQVNIQNSEENVTTQQESLAGSKIQETSVASAEEHNSDFFENSTSPKRALMQEAKEEVLSPSISQNNSSNRTPKTCHLKKDIKNKIALNVVKCLFKKMGDKSCSREEGIEKTIGNECTISRKQSSRTDSVTLPKSNFSQFCQDYSTQDFSINTIDQICQVSEIEFDSPLSPELSVSYIKDKNYSKVSQPKLKKHSSEKSGISENMDSSKASQPKLKKHSSEKSGVSENIDHHSKPAISCIKTGLPLKNKDEFLVPSIPPITPFCKTKISEEEALESVKVNGLSVKSKLKNLIYLINDSTCTQVIDVNTCSEDILKNAFLFEEDPTFLKRGKIPNKGSQQNLNKAIGFVPFSNLIVDSLSQFYKPPKDPSEECHQESLSEHNSKSCRLKTNEYKHRIIQSHDRNEDKLELMNDIAMNMSKSGTNLYTVSDTQMFGIGELIDANLTGNSSMSMNETSSDSNFSVCGKTKETIAHKRKNTNFNAISLSPPAACDNVSEEMVITQIPKIKNANPEMKDSFISSHLPCNTSSSSKSYFEESYLAKCYSTPLETISVLDQTITGDLESSVGCDNTNAAKLSSSCNTSSENKNELSTVQETVGAANCEERESIEYAVCESIRKGTCPEFGFSTARGKPVSVSETALSNARRFLEHCDGSSIPDQQIVVAGFPMAEDKKGSTVTKYSKYCKNVLLPKNPSNKSEHTSENCHKNTFPSSASSAGLSPESGKKVQVSKSALHEACQLPGHDANRLVEQSNMAGFSSVSLKTRQLLHDSTPLKQPAFAGFETASGKKHTVLESSLTKARKLLETCDDHTPVAKFLKSGINTSKQSVRSCGKISPRKSMSTAGFSTASGKNVSVSVTALNKARHSLESCDENRPFELLAENGEKGSSFRITASKNRPSQGSYDNNSTSVSATPFVGFSTARGKKVAVSENMLNEARLLFEDLVDNTPTKKLSTFEFSTVSNKGISMSGITPNKEYLMETRDENTPVISSSLTNIGFSTASGKQVSVSKTALNKAKQLLENCDDTTPIRKPSLFGFSVASGKKVSMSETSLTNSRQLCETSDNMPVRQSTTVGSSVAIDRKNSVSKSALNKAWPVLDTCDNQIPVGQTSIGFSTASGKTVSVSEDALDKARQLLETYDNVTPNRKTSEIDFSAARSGKVFVSEDLLQKARQSFETCNEDTAIKDYSNAQLTTNRKKSCLLYRKLVDTQQELDCSYSEPSNKSASQKCLKIGCQKFSSEGNSKKSMESVSRSVDLSLVQKRITSDSSLKTSEKEFLPEVNSEEYRGNNSLEKSVVSTDNRNCFKEVIAVQNNPLKLPNMSPGLAQEVSESTAALMIDEENSQSGTDWLSFGGETANSTNQVSNLDSYFNHDIKDEDDGSTSPEVISRRGKKRKCLKTVEHMKRRNISGRNSPACTISNSSLSFPSSERAREINQNQLLEELPRSLMFKKGILHKSTPKLELSKKREREADVCPSFRKRLKDCVSDSQEALPKNEVFLKRLKATEEQEEIIRLRQKKKNTAQEKGNYLRRKLAGDRISLKCAVLGHQPKIYSEEELQSYGVFEAVIQVTSENASKFRFSAWDHYSNEICEKNTEGITVGDSVKIILDENGTAGLIEIKRGFLSSPGIDTAIVPDNWVENHFKWIIWKLACMELRFPQIFARKYLTMENLLYQLRYRYDREIDQAQRPCLRKILECDEAASKKMILCVAKIIQLNSNIELELTDGWYSVKAVIDAAMMSLIQRKKVSVGTKLMTQGAELLNCEQGCDPLEMRENVRLKIHTNCTRRGRWYVKMGFFHEFGPIQIRLDSVLCGGGVVGKLHLFVARVYPMLYLSKAADGKSVLLNEKLENFQQINEERDRTKKMETLFNEVKKELEEENSKETISNRRSFSRKQVSSLTSGQELFECLETALDPAAIQLTDEQVCALSEYKRKKEERMVQELHFRVQERLRNDDNAKKTSTPLLKVRVVDSSKAYDNTESAAILTVWRPPEEVSSFLKEGYFINVYNVLPSNSRFGDMSLSANFHTRYETVSKDLNHPLSRTVSDFSNISEPLFGEVDIVGVVIHVETAPTGKGKTYFQKVYLADLDENFLAISFCNGVANFGWSDIVRKNAILACCNLQWAGGKVAMKIPLLFSSEVSVFTGQPKMKHVEVALQKLKHDLPLKKIPSFVKSQENILCAILEKNSSAKDTKSKTESGKRNENDLAAIMNGSMFAEETLSNLENVTAESNVEQQKIDDSLTPLQQKVLRLQYYSPAPSLPKLHLKPTSKLRKEFKVPSKIDETN